MTCLEEYLDTFFEHEWTVRENCLDITLGNQEGKKTSQQMCPQN